MIKKGIFEFTGNGGGEPDATCPEGLARCPDGSCKNWSEC